VGGWTQRLSLAVSGSQKAIEAAFNTHFVSYKTSEGVLYGPKEKPAFSVALPVDAVANLVFAPNLMQRSLVHGAIPSGAGQNHAFGYVPQQIAAAFDFNGAYNAGFRGAGISIGTIGAGPIDQKDYMIFKQQFNVTGSATITQVDATPQAAAVVQNGLGTGSPVATPRRSPRRAEPPSRAVIPRMSRLSLTRSKPQRSATMRACCSIWPMFRKALLARKSA
jgi:hypothetical protein